MFFIIRHLHISHNAPHLPPKFCITFVFHFSWVLQPSHEKLKTMLIQNFGWQIRCIMGDVQVAYKHTQEVPSLGLIIIIAAFVLINQKVLLCHYTVSHIK